MPAPGLGGLNDGRDEDWIARRLLWLQKQIDQLVTARSSNNSSISAGGSLSIDAGGWIPVRNASGSVIGFLGTEPGTGHAGLQTNASTGRLMFASLGVGVSGQTYTGVYDSTGALVVGDDPQYGGLLRPYLPMGPMVDFSVPGTSPASPTSDTWVTMQAGFCVRAHGAVEWHALVSSSDSSTTGNVRLVDAASNVIGSAVTVTPNAVSTVQLGPVRWPTGSWTPNDASYVSVQAQRTGGTGQIGVRTTGLVGVGSS